MKGSKHLETINSKALGLWLRAFNDLFFGVWNPSNPRTRFWEFILLEHLANQFVVMETTILITVVILACINLIVFTVTIIWYFWVLRHSANSCPFFSIVWYSLPIISVSYSAKCRHFRLGFKCSVAVHRVFFYYNWIQLKHCLKIAWTWK